ncbi:MAG: TraM recognition domain-containing protein [Flavisolibacter sp.]
MYYWQKEFPILKSSSIGPILTRLDAFLRPKVIRNMVCQTKSLNFQELMDSKKIVLVKLSQGLLGTENSYLLGAVIVSKLQQIAMARQAQAATERVPFYCYIDEFHHFVTPSMASILSGARKYGLGLILAHQDMQQVSKYDTEIANSLLSNAGTRICFRLGDTDAKRLQEGFASFSAEDLQNLPIGEAIARVNTSDADFNLSVLPFDAEDAISYKEEILSYSRNTYSVAKHSATAPSVQPEKPYDDVSPIPPKEPIHTHPIPEDSTAQREQIREHRYLQTFVKAMAEAQGYKASVEAPTPDGKGLVDVLLEKNGQTIAVEISVTTNPEWELHNIQKCLAAGYSRIVICATQPAKLKLIQQQIATHLSEQEQTRVQVIAANDLNSLFMDEPQAQPPETVVKGYRVKVNYEANAPRQDLLQSIINATKKR